MKITERNHNESAKDYVVRQLIYNIVHLNLIPGQKLETPQLCELLHVSSYACALEDVEEILKANGVNVCKS